MFCVLGHAVMPTAVCAMQEALLDRSGLTSWPSVHGSVKQPLIPLWASSTSPALTLPSASSTPPVPTLPSASSTPPLPALPALPGRRCVTMNQVRGIFGFTMEDNIGKIAFPAVQASHDGGEMNQKWWLGGEQMA